MGILELTVRENDQEANVKGQLRQIRLIKRLMK
jgi:hypothetical protein